MPVWHHPPFLWVFFDFLLHPQWRSDLYFLHNLVSERRHFRDKLGCFIYQAVEIFCNSLEMHGGVGGLQFYHSKADSISDSFPYRLCIVILSTFKQTSEIFELMAQEVNFLYKILQERQLRSRSHIEKHLVQSLNFFIKAPIKFCPWPRPNS